MVFDHKRLKRHFQIPTANEVTEFFYLSDEYSKEFDKTLNTH